MTLPAAERRAIRLHGRACNGGRRKDSNQRELRGVIYGTIFDRAFVLVQIEMASTCLSVSRGVEFLSIERTVVSTGIAQVDLRRMRCRQKTINVKIPI